eukprot:1154748-Pelagomonas_calceolata.AAC.2
MSEPASVDVPGFLGCVMRFMSVCRVETTAEGHQCPLYTAFQLLPNCAYWSGGGHRMASDGGEGGEAEQLAQQV